MAASGNSRIAGERGRWTAFLLWTFAIFTVVPVATGIREWIVGRLGAQALFWTMLAVLVTAVAVSVRRSRTRLTVRQSAWVLGIAVLVGAWGWGFRRTAEPAHFVSYAILAVLAFRALEPRFRDRGVYLVAAALTTLVGIVDESVQWLVPGRYWDLRDIAIDTGIGILVQLLIWKGFRPASVAPGVSPRSLRAGVRVLAAAAALLLLCVSNTPARTAWLADRLPGLGYLLTARGSRMVEYGHALDDPAIGRFFSRLSREELARVDRERGAEAARILERYRRPRRHAELRRLYPAWRDPYVFELRERLSARGRLQAQAFKRGRDQDEARRLATAAYRENLILERYFPTALEAFGGRLRPRLRERLEHLHQPESDFTSRIDDHLITSWSESQARAALLVLLAVLLAADVACGRKIARRKMACVDR